MSYSNDIYKAILLDHIENPRNRNKLHENYKSFTLKNPSCGDVITVNVLLENDLIKDINYEIEGCSVCLGSASIMSTLLKEETLIETEKIIKEFNNMMIGEPFNESILKDAISLKGVKEIPARIKCASLPYKAFEKAIGGEKNV